MDTEIVNTIIIDPVCYEDLLYEFTSEKKPLKAEIDGWLNYFNKKPFQERERKIFSNKFKRNFIFINTEIDEEEEQTIPKIKFKITTDGEEVNRKEAEEELLKDIRIETENPKIGTLNPSKEIFLLTKEILKKYIDTSELNYNLLTTWTLGTYFHNQFETYPLLILNARKQSGKSRTLKLLSSLSDGGDGSTSTSVTETFLFRHLKGSLFFDEMESISSKEKTALRETINAIYKKGNKIVRYTEKKVDGAKTYVEEPFYPYYPLGLANIQGFNDILEDRSIQIILQRSNKKQTQLIEDFSTNREILGLKERLDELNTKIPDSIFSKWNDYVETKECPEDLKNLFDKISNTKLNGRPLELFFPLFLVAERFDFLDVLIKNSVEYVELVELVESIDDILYNWVTEISVFKGFNNISEILMSFRGYLEEIEPWMNVKWFGRALKRLGLVKRKRLIHGKTQIEFKITLPNSTYSTNSTNSTNSTTTNTNTNNNNTNSTTNPIKPEDFFNNNDKEEQNGSK